jgi:aldehyde dehydrogenase family 7 protein A1
VFQVIAEVVEASVDDYEKGMSACFDAAKAWMAVSTHTHSRS